MERIDAFASELGVELDDGQLEALEGYGRLLQDQAVRLGMIAASDRDRVMERHVLDCLRCVPELPEDGRCLDLGSGAGLPGVVVAIARPALSALLVERRSKRAGFLEHVVRTLGLRNCQVAAQDISDLPAGSAESATARALAPLPKAWLLARALLAPGGRLVYFAGRGSGPPPELAGSSLVQIRSGESPPEAGPLVIITRDAELA